MKPGSRYRVSWRYSVLNFKLCSCTYLVRQTDSYCLFSDVPHTIEAFFTRCPQTPSVDLLEILSGILAIVYALFFFGSNISVWCYVNQTFGGNLFQFTHIKYITVGGMTLGAFSCLWALILQDENTSGSFSYILPGMILTPLLALLLNLYKERYFTFPFLVTKFKRLKRMVGCLGQDVAPAVPHPYPGILEINPWNPGATSSNPSVPNPNSGILELNPRNIVATSSNRYSDEGGIYVGTSTSTPLTLCYRFYGALLKKYESMLFPVSGTV